MGIGENGNKPVAIVTGGGTGIGAATAALLSESGWDVAICGRRASLLDKVAAETGARAIPVDMSVESSAEEVVGSVLDQFGRIDGVVLNAAIARAGSFSETSDWLWREMLETNLVSAARLTRAVISHFPDSGGSVVGVASLAALRASSFLSGYAASKAGLGLMLQSVAVEFGKAGVRANLVCPGLVKTEMSASSLSAVAERDGVSLDAAYDLATRPVPLRRAGASSEIASVIAFLLSEGASYLTGTIIPVDGGASAVDVAALVYEDN
ncbi:SDR family oxidoreductase [Citricoccus alkalitolerans]|uniref:SDR family NAD(P)-dependent oxidoreductase n=1 Tax=Citricoccus alkalitolerans TaxID=246603 RepID=A0ABV8XWT8_9MICC